MTSSDPNLANQKRALRQLARARLSQITVDQRRTHSAAAVDLLLSRPEWRQAERILAFLPLKDELDLSPALAAALRSGKTVALPRFEPAVGQYSAAILTYTSDPSDPFATLSTGAFGIREPASFAPTLPLNQLDFILVPGVAFDASGRRIGRGKGFYDRLLAETNSNCLKCGVAVDDQLIEGIPVEPHDIAMNVILTPGRWLTVATPPT